MKHALPYKSKLSFKVKKGKSESGFYFNKSIFCKNVFKRIID